MKVSVIIPCFNYGLYLHEAIESVISQTYNANEIEIIVVNDGSIDNTEEIAKRYNVTLLNQQNLGLPTARNNGIKYSKGQYILPLDADDKIHPQYIEKTITILENNPDIGVVYTHREHFGLIKTVKFAEKFNLDRLKEKCILNYCSLFRKQVWLDCNGYNHNMFQGYEDWDFWLSVSEKKWKFYLVNEVLFYYRKHGISLSSIAKENHINLINILKSNHQDLFSEIENNTF